MKKETNQEKLSRLVNADFNDMIQRKLIFIHPISTIRKNEVPCQKNRSNHLRQIDAHPKKKGRFSFSEVPADRE